MQTPPTGEGTMGDENPQQTGEEDAVRAGDAPTGEAFFADDAGAGAGPDTAGATEDTASDDTASDDSEAAVADGEAAEDAATPAVPQGPEPVAESSEPEPAASVADPGGVDDAADGVEAPAPFVPAEPEVPTDTAVVAAVARNAGAEEADDAVPTITSSEAVPADEGETADLPPTPVDDADAHGASADPQAASTAAARVAEAEVAAATAHAATGEAPAEKTSAAEATAGASPAEEATALTPLLVDTAQPPRPQGNRWMGILIGVVSTIAFAVADGALALGIFWLQAPRTAIGVWEHYLQTVAFWGPAIVFFLASALVVAVVNRAGWWAHILGSLFVGAVVYLASVAAAMVTAHSWALDLGQIQQFARVLWISPLTISAGLVAREASLWFGAWISARGRRVRARNLEARREYDRGLEADTTAPAA